MSVPSSEIQVIKEAFPSITDDNYIKRLLLTLTDPPFHRLQNALSFLANPSKPQIYVSPFELMSSELAPHPSNIPMFFPGKTDYHIQVSLQLKKQFPVLPMNKILQAMHQNRNLLILTYFHIQKNLSIGSQYSFCGTVFQPDNAPIPPTNPTNPHLISDLRILENPLVHDHWMHRLNAQINPFPSGYPVIPEPPSFLPPLTFPTSDKTHPSKYDGVLSQCDSCGQLTPLLFLTQCPLGHSFCPACFHKISSNSNIHSLSDILCPNCKAPFAHAVLADYLHRDIKRRLFPNTLLASYFPSDTVRSGICPYCFYPLQPTPLPHTWTCSCNIGFNPNQQATSQARNFYLL